LPCLVLSLLSFLSLSSSAPSWRCCLYPLLRHSRSLGQNGLCRAAGSPLPIRQRGSALLPFGDGALYRPLYMPLSRQGNNSRFCSAAPVTPWRLLSLKGSGPSGQATDYTRAGAGLCSRGSALRCCSMAAHSAYLPVIEERRAMTACGGTGGGRRTDLACLLLHAFPIAQTWRVGVKKRCASLLYHCYPHFSRAY